jgi:hypothetical protein
MVAEARERAVAAGKEEEEGGETISQCPRDLAPPAAVLLREEREAQAQTEVETQTETGRPGETRWGGAVITTEEITGATGASRQITLPAVMTEVAGMAGASGGEAAGAPATRERGPATDTSPTGEEAVAMEVVGEGVLVPVVGVTPTAAVRVLVGVAVVGASR